MERFISLSTALLCVLACTSVVSAIEEFTNVTIAVSAENPIKYDDVIASGDPSQGVWICTHGWGGQRRWLVQESGGPDGSAYITRQTGNKWAGAVIFAVKDDKQTKGLQTLAFDFLLKNNIAAGNDPMLAFRVIGIQDPEGDGWDGGIQGQGGTSPWGPEQSAQYKREPYEWNSENPEDGTYLHNVFTRNNEALSIGLDWQNYEAEVDFGDGYDWVILSFGHAFGNPNGTTAPALELGIDNVIHPWTAGVNPVLPSDPSPTKPQELDVAQITLSWSAGEGAQSHNVYFGDDKGSLVLVSEAQAGTTYALTEFATGKTYAWRVGEVQADGSEVLGPIWKLQIKAFIEIDNFDNYSEVMGDPNDILSNWMVNEASSAFIYISGTSYAGTQSMQMVFENDGDIFYEGLQLEVETFAEVYRELDASQKDWTRSDVKALQLSWHGYWYGDHSNDYESFTSEYTYPGDTDKPYIALEDGAGKKATVYWKSSGDLAQRYWHVWDIALTEFTGVDLTDIAKVYLGVGQANSTSGAHGEVFFDELRLYQARPLAKMAKSAGDLDSDGDVDNDDLAILQSNLGAGGPKIAPQDPSTTGLVTYLKLDGNLNDELGNVTNGKLYGDAGFATGLTGQALELDSMGDYADLGAQFGGSVLASLNSFSCSVWTKAVARGGWDWPRIWQVGSSDSKYFALLASSPEGSYGALGGPRFEMKDSDNPDGKGNNLTVNAPMAADYGEWMHIVVALDDAADQVDIFVNGQLAIRGHDVPRTPSQNIDAFTQNFIGMDHRLTNFHNGLVDELRFYNRALSQAEAAGLAGLTDPVSVLAYGDAANSDLDDDGDVDADDEALLQAEMGQVVLWP